MSARAVARILATDALRLGRDQFLVGASVYIAACAVALRWAIPWVQGELLTSNGVDITPWIPLGVSYFVVVNASVITGMLGGFLLLESREERTLQALLVTPTPLPVHLGTLAAAVTFGGIAITAALAALVGVGTPEPAGVIAAAAVGAPSGFVMTLILATVAANKVEAFAVLKLISILGLLPVAGYFLPEPLQFAVGVVPAYWGCKIWWVAEAGGSWAWMVVPGLIVNGLWIRVLLPRFLAAARR